MADLDETKLVLNVKKLDAQAKLPTKAHSTDGGWDLYALKEILVPPGFTMKISTGIAVEIPEGYVGVIHDRSSMAGKSITIFGGVIDSGYTGEITIVMHNTFHTDPEYQHTIKPGDKVAQMLILPVPDIEVKEVKELSQSSRGEKGFGSSGR